MTALRIPLAFLTALLSVVVLTSVCGGVALAAELVLPEWILDNMIHMLLVPVLLIPTGALSLREQTRHPRARKVLVGACLLLYAVGGYQLLEMAGLPGLAWPFAALPVLGLLRLTVESIRQMDRPVAARRSVRRQQMITLPRSNIVRLGQTAS